MTEAELFKIALDSRLMDLHTSMPGKVEKVSSNGQIIDVLPQFKRAVPDGEGDYVIEDLPVLPNVRVCFPRGGGYFASFPIQKGDMVLLVFSERAIGAWIKKGEACDPGDRRMHPLSGAVAIPGLYPSGSELDDADGTNMVIGKDGTATSQIEFSSSGIKLGKGDDAVVTKKDLQALYFAINSAAVVAMDGGASFKAAILATLAGAGWSSDPGDGQLGSSKIKAARL
jgi:hypothetical protein